MGPVLITGATGWVGGAVLRRLIDDPEHRPVRALVRTNTAAEQIRAIGAEPVFGDVRDPASLTVAMTRCDVVYHVAGLNLYCLADPSPLFQANVDGSVNVMRAAADLGVRRVVYTSSAATIGERQGTVATEESEHRGTFHTQYERSKYEAEVAVRRIATERAVDVVTVNPSSVQGPGRSTGTAELLIGFLDKRVVPAVHTRLSIVDVDDCAEAHLLAERNGAGGERYLVSGATLTVGEATRLLRQIAGAGAQVVYLPGIVAEAGGIVAEFVAQVRGMKTPICREMVRVLRHGHAYDGSKATRELGLEYRPVGHTLARTAAWYVDMGFVRRPLPRMSKG
jgi:dihydroflavonol-4-reductase